MSNVPLSLEPVTRGQIIIARHGRPALDRNEGPRLTWAQYVAWWARYEDGALAEGQNAPQALIDATASARVLMTSERLRAQQTLRAARPEGEVSTHGLFNEAPLPPPRWPGLRLLPKTWNIVARIAWMMGHTLDDESVVAARARAKAAAELLHEKSLEGTVFLAAHGWFNRMIRPELKRMGWHCVEDGGDRYWGYRRYEFPLEDR